jgi:hypothetical protein
MLVVALRIATEGVAGRPGEDAEYTHTYSQQPPAKNP